MNTTHINFWIALLALLFSSAVLAGCDTDRFNDRGCASDLECRGERICDSHRCIHPDQLVPEDDAGGEEDADEQGIRIQDLLGHWDMVANGEVEQSDGSAQELDDEPTPVLIREGAQTDVEVVIGDAAAGDEGMCGLGANLTADGFEFVPEGCEVELDGGQRGSYENVEGRGTLDNDGTLRFDLQTTVFFEGPDTPAMNAEIDVVLEGPRADDEPGI